MSKKLTFVAGLTKILSCLTLGCLCGLGSSTVAHGQTTITVHNKSDQTIYVTGTQDRQRLVESSDGVEVDSQVAASAKVSGSGSIGIPEVLDVSQSMELEASGSSREYSNVTQARKYDWSPFIEAGEQEIPAGRSGTFSISKTDIYYLTVRRKAGYICVNVPKSVATDQSIYVDGTGFAGRPADKPLTTQSVVKLKNKNTQKYLGSWDSGEYVLMQDSGVNWLLARGELQTLKHGTVVAIKHQTRGGTLYLYGNDWLCWNSEDKGAIARFTVKKIREGSSPGDEIRPNDYIQLEWTNEGGHRISHWNDTHAAIEDTAGKGDTWQVIVD